MKDKPPASAEQAWDPQQFLNQVVIGSFDTRVQRDTEFPSEGGGDSARDQTECVMSATNEGGYGAPLDLNVEIARLAGLHPVEFERIRKAEAKRLGCRVLKLDDLVRRARPETQDTAAGGTITFDQPEPWPEPVDGAELILEIGAIIRRHVDMSVEATLAVALWIVNAYAHDLARHSPLLLITSPAPRCGKTTLLNILTALVPRPLAASNITASPLFRSIDQWTPTILIDEADTFLNKLDLRGLLNSGHTRDTAYIVRSERVGDSFVPTRFRTWAPKAVALIGSLHPTLCDRSIEIRLRRKLHTKTMQRLREIPEAPVLRRKLVRFVQDNRDALRALEPLIPSELHDRAADNWEPLLAIADVAGGIWPELGRRAARMLSAESATEEVLGVELLRDVRQIFEQRGVTRIHSQDLADRLCGLEGRPWAELKDGRSLTPNSLAGMLKPFDIRPKQMIIANINRNGYELAGFEDEFARYL